MTKQRTHVKYFVLTNEESYAVNMDVAWISLIKLIKGDPKFFEKK